MAIAVNSESVRSLREYSNKINESVEEIKNSTNTMENVTDQYSGRLGPHADQIKQALLEIKSAVWQGVVPANEISEKLVDVADAYQEIIDTNYYGGSGK